MTAASVRRSAFESLSAWLPVFVASVVTVSEPGPEVFEMLKEDGTDTVTACAPSPATVNEALPVEDESAVTPPPTERLPSVLLIETEPEPLDG